MADPAQDAPETPPEVAGAAGGAAPEVVPAAMLAAAKEEARAAREALATLKTEAAAREVAAAEAAKAAEKAAREKQKAGGDLLGIIEGQEKELETLRARVVELEADNGTLSAREAERIAAVQARNEERVAALPESFRELVASGLDPMALSSHIDRVEAAAAKVVRPVGGKGGHRKPTAASGDDIDYPRELLEAAARLDMRPEVYAATSLGKKLLAKSA